MVIETHPTTFAELLHLSLVSHGTDVYGTGNAQDDQASAGLCDYRICQDDIMVYLMHKSLDR